MMDVRPTLLRPFRVAALALSLSFAVGAALARTQGPAAGAQGAPESEPELPLREQIVPRTDALLARHDCLACHAPDSALRATLDPVLAPRLEGLLDRAHPAWIEGFLLDPRGTRPGTSHPHQLAGLPEATRPQIALDLTHFLARQDDIQPIVGAGETATIGVLEAGRALYHGVGCVVCHGAQESDAALAYSLAELQDGVEPAPSREPVRVPDGVLELPDLPLPPDLTAKQLPSGLAAYLQDPLSVRPSGHCPSFDLTEGEARAIATYLLRRGAQGDDGRFGESPGLVREVYELDDLDGDLLARIDRLEPVTRGATTTIEVGEAPREDLFALRFSGWLDVPEDGTYTFHVTSDDDARLTIDGARVVDLPGEHPAEERSGTVELYRGRRAFTLDYVERAGQQVLELEWEGPGVERGPLPEDGLSHWPLAFRYVGPDGTAASYGTFAVDQARADRGEAAFVELACAQCHSVEGFRPRGTGPDVPSFERLSGVRPGVLVCLRPGGRYDLPPEDVGGLLGAFFEPASIAEDALVPQRAVERALARRNCYGCHRREGIGGVHPSLIEHFRGDENAELGDQGRFPPTLTAVGRKLQPDVLDGAIHGHERVRPYLKVRMPRIGDENLLTLAASLESVDRSRPAVPPLADGDRLECSPALIDQGRRLAGVRGGLDCVQCHDFRGSPSLGIRAVDLESVHRRLRFQWFRELLLAPANVDLEARMANLWLDGKSPVTDIADGDVEAQIQRLWCWLGEGESMAPPPGLDTGEWAFELAPTERTRLVSVFMEGVSPRVLCVGTPAGIHAAFDFEGGRLAKLWRGRFLNVRGTWQGRAGALESPGSGDVFEPPSGPVVLPSDGLVDAWRDAADVRALAREVGDDGSVTFEYEVEGVLVRDTLTPAAVRSPEGESRTGFRRRVEVTVPPGGVGRPVIARIGVARRLDPAGRGTWRATRTDWPLFRVLGDAARSAQVVEPKRSITDEERGEGAAAVDMTERTRVRHQEAARVGPPLEELRVPLSLRPDTDGAPSGHVDPRSLPLVGSLEWEFAW